MNQQELEALVAQIAPNNDPRRLDYSEGTETIEVEERPKDPATGAEQTWAEPVKRKVPVRTLTWVDRGTGQTLKVQVDPTTGTYTKTFQGTDPKQQGEPATTPAQVAKDEQGTEIGSEQVTDAQGKTVKRTTYRRADGTTYTREDSVQAAPEKPTIAQGTAGRPAVQYVPDPDHPGQVKAVPVPGAPAAPPEQISAPPTQQWVVQDNHDGTFTTVKNPNWVKPSKIGPHPSDPNKMVEYTVDDDGKPIILPVNDQTTIKPADLPVLQTKYGEIAQGLGALAQDLNSRYARGEITEKQRQDAFTAAHQQASTQVAEINSILENSRAIWTGQVNQRGQTLGETQSRRAYASDIFGRAAQTGMSIAESAGPGHGADIAGGVQALMGMGQRYAEGMGGFRESPEIGLPPALQQAQGIGLPGYGAPGPAPAPGGPPPPPPGGPPSPSAGGGLPAPIFRPPPPVAGGAAPQISAAPTSVAPAGVGPPARDDWRTNPGLPGVTPPAATGLGTPDVYRGAPPGGHIQDPGVYRPPPGGADSPGFFRPEVQGLQGMGQALQSGFGYAGSPVAAGGLGVYDPTQDMQRMVGDGTDPDWENAVRQAAAAANQPGYAWQRFG